MSAPNDPQFRDIHLFQRDMGSGSNDVASLMLTLLKISLFSVSGWVILFIEYNTSLEEYPTRTIS